MTLFISQLNPNSSEFKTNQLAMDHLVEQLHHTLNQIKLGGNKLARARHTEYGKLLPRDRLAHLLDPNSPFLELSPLAAFEVYDEPVPAAGIITGIGLVSATLCMIIINDATVKGGSYSPLTIKKHLRAQEIALENHLPCIYLVDSGGLFLPKQHEGFADKDHFGRIFFNQAQLSAQRIPQIAVVLGSCTAGGAYLPAMADEAIMVKNQATLFLAGPPLVKAAIGEIISAEALGGADMHCRQSGVADYYAENDTHALDIARRAIKHINRTHPHTINRITTCEPRYACEELHGIIPVDPRKTFDMREIIARIVDGSEFDEFKRLYGTTLVCGFAHLHGYPVGILANNGILFAESALKGTHFIELCTQRGIPLIFLQNITGFMVGSKAEIGGVAKHGAKMVMAVANARVPKFTVMVGGSFGAGNYAMCGRAFGARFVWAWPNARVAVMGGEQAADVLIHIKREKQKKSGVTWSAEQEQQFKEQLMREYAAQSHAYYASARLWDDGIIAPQDTRTILGLSLWAAHHAPIEHTNFGVFRM